jgi:flagellar biosynthesis/type III secretory pathway chaperone
MFAELIDTIVSLISLMEEESDRLVCRGPHPDLPEIAEAKVRLVALLEAQTAQLDRERPNWKRELDPEEHARLADVLVHLGDASAVNAKILSRQIELSTEMMAAVAAEAQRLMGTTNATYGAHGGLFQMDQATPISLNTRL